MLFAEVGSHSAMTENTNLCFNYDNVDAKGAITGLVSASAFQDTRRSEVCSLVFYILSCLTNWPLLVGINTLSRRPAIPKLFLPTVTLRFFGNLGYE